MADAGSRGLSSYRREPDPCTSPYALAAALCALLGPLTLGATAVIGFGLGIAALIDTTRANGQTSLITYYAGKRCWINKVIFGEPAASQLAPNPDPSKRPVFVAGDSDTDLAMLKDATVLKLVIERHKLEVSCNAWANYQNKWLHQPMFIEPKSAPAAGAFACPTGVDPDGAPIKDESGAQFPKALP